MPIEYQLHSKGYYQEKRGAVKTAEGIQGTVTAKDTAKPE
jgi:hypothetical protein